MDGVEMRAVAGIPRLSPSTTKGKGEVTWKTNVIFQGMIEAGNENEGNHFTVDWEGPDDPNNPKKSGLPIGLHCTLHVKLTDLPLQLDIPQEMGRDGLGIRLHFPEPRLVRHDCASRTQDRGGVSYNKFR